MIVKYLIIKILIIAVNVTVVPQTFYSQNIKTGKVFQFKEFTKSIHNLKNYPSRTISDDFSNLTRSVSNVLSSPIYWDSSDLIKVGSFFALTAGAFLIDDEVRDIYLRNRNKTFNSLEPAGYSYGSPHFTIPGALALYFSGVTFENNWLRDTGLMLTETIATIGIIQVPSRIIFGRARPYTGNKNSSFTFLKGVGQDKASFISGHAAIAFGISNILSHQINNTAATIGLYGLATLTPLARLYDDKHWFSDIVIGTAIGIFVSNAIISLHKGKTISENYFSITPTLNGISFNLHL